MNCNDISTFYPYLIGAGVIFAVSIFFTFKVQDDLHKQFPEKEDYIQAVKDLYKDGDHLNTEKPRIYQILAFALFAFVAFNYYQCVG